ncbi:adenosylmethionine--8-amino-7-oxononanoate transaminase [Helicobacter pylori]|uniref:adenosylmethionine--8-amino-7-oxononanoate transaminase n=1 Tax=Helicobacter pylori TaxID=210 RepID=UPI001923039A|nr:adenosylmethionine--8-amino-7-oxononanoate transaminase [Helicobacter pylori]QQW75104.1 adenosylmethionine--8-amino-7-oxononanoate transaminase [Helicobacter pylori]
MNFQENLAALDLEYLWHPCSQMQEHQNFPIIPIKKAQGIYLYDFNDNAYMDLISSWWVNLFGHNNAYISQQLKNQIDDLEHVLLASFSHKPIITLSQRLCQLTSMDKCFYADNGSSCIEIALKMSYHAHFLKDQTHPKKLFLSLSNSYHGETLGALSVGDVKLYKDTYTPLLLKNLITPVPKNDSEIENSLNALKRLLDEHGREICAFIAEPLLQCAGNMHIYSAKYLKQAVLWCKQKNIHIIFDEIATGFGRTGSMFAYEQCGIKPDFLCLSKGISGGYLPLSVLLTHNEIYNQFYAPYEENKAFLHSHSYTGNALACACANATLDIFEKENIIEKNKALSEFIFSALQNALKDLIEQQVVSNLRHLGMVFAFEVFIQTKERLSLAVFKKALKKGLLLRPLNNTIYLMPPYIITHEEIKKAIAGLVEAIDELKKAENK